VILPLWDRNSKSQITNSKQYQNPNDQNSKQWAELGFGRIGLVQGNERCIYLINCPKIAQKVGRGFILSEKDVWR
jgi:hypothetical protein